jgi:F-type H+-transporting ATPase subunit b
MRRILLACCLLGLALAFSLALPVRAAGKKEGKSDRPPVYKSGNEEFDLSKPEDRKKLRDLLEKGAEHPISIKEEESSFVEKVADLAIWTTLVFLAMLWVLKRYAWGPIQAGLEHREHSIQQAIDDARVAREETEKLRQELAGERARANDEARQIRDQARQAAEKIAADYMAKGKAELQAERERLEREVATERDQALHQIFMQAADLATLISSKAVRRQLNADDHRRLLDEALAEFRQAGTARRQDLESVRA